MQPALHVVLELARASDSNRPDAVAEGEWNRYLLRWPDDSGRYEQGELVWGAEIEQALAAARDAATQRLAIERLSTAARSLLEAAGWSRIVERIVAARDRGRGTIVTLRPAAHELYALPWELLDVRGTPLYATEDCVLRYAIVGSDVPPVRPAPSGRIVIAAAGAGVPTAEHVEAIRAAAGAAGIAMDRERDVLSGATCEGLRQVLAAGDVTILHVLCHGEPITGGRGFGLRLDREGAPISPEQMAALLRPYAGPLRLVVLAACFGAATPAIDHALDNIAQAIHGAGVHAVIASRYLLTASGSSELARVLYEQLWCHKASLQQAFIASRTALRLRLRGDGIDVDAMAIQLHGGDVSCLDFRPWIFRPYRGLSPYERDDAAFFVGREDDRAALRRLIERALSSGAPRFVLVAGASGTGKSSVVRAGLVPDLETGRLPGYPRWRSASMRPGEGGPPIDLLSRLDLRCDGDFGVVLIVDQLEEIFTEVGRDEDRAAFLRELWRLACEPAGRVFVVATMRIDYLGYLGGVPMDGGHAAFDHEMLATDRCYLLRQLTIPDYERIVRQPAALVGVQIERGLVERLLEDLRTSPGALPLLSFALDRLWQDRSFQTAEVDADPPEPAVAVTGWWLTHAAYLALGGVAGSLARSADQLLRSLEPEELDELRRVLVQLVQGHDDPQLITRRRGWCERLRPDPVAWPEAARRFDRVVDRWVQARLLVSGSLAPGAPVWLELAHDSLIRLWPTFQRWYAEARAWLGQAEELLRATLDWEAHPGDSQEAYLLRGQRLAYHLEAWGRYQPHLGAGDHARARAFLEACQLAEVHDLERKTLAARTSAIAEERAVAARDAAIVAGALQLRDAGHPASATKLLTEVARPLQTQGWMALAWDQLADTALECTLRPPGNLQDAQLSPDGASVLTIASGKVRLWRANGAGESILLREQSEVVETAVFAPNSALVYTVATDGALRRWRVGGATPPSLIDCRMGDFSGLVFSPCGRWFLSCGEHGAIIWQVARRPPVCILPHAQRVEHASFGPDSKWVVTVCEDGAARLWRPDLGPSPPPRPRTLNAVAALHQPAWRGEPNRVWTVQFASDGKSVVTMGREVGEIYFWPFADLTSPRRFEAEERVIAVSAGGRWIASSDGPILVLRCTDESDVNWRRDIRLNLAAELEWRSYRNMYAEFSPDGSRLAVQMDQGKDIYVLTLDGSRWDTESARRFQGHTGAIKTLEFSRDSRLLLSTARDETARIWRVAPETTKILALNAVKDVGVLRVLGASLNEQGGVAVLVALHGTVTDGQAELSPVCRSYRVTAGGRQCTDLVHEANVIHSGSAWSHDGTAVATATFDGRVHVWSGPAEPGGAVTHLVGHQQAVWSTSFSRDGRRIVTGSADGTARIWDGSDGSTVAVLAGHSGAVMSVAFSADGQWVATGSRDDTARVWQVSNPRDPIVVHCEFPRVALSRDGTVLLTRGQDLPSQVWRLDQGSPQQPVISVADVSAAALDEQGDRVLFGTSQGEAQLWHLEDPVRRVDLAVHTSAVRCVAFSPDGQLVATASWEPKGLVQVSWLAEPSQFLVLPVSDAPFALQFSADSQRLLVVQEMTVSLWTVGLESTLDRLRAATSDCLPAALRQRYLGETPEQASMRYEECETHRRRGPGAG